MSSDEFATGISRTKSIGWLSNSSEIAPARRCSDQRSERQLGAVLKEVKDSQVCSSLLAYNKKKQNKITPRNVCLIRREPSETKLHHEVSKSAPAKNNQHVEPSASLHDSKLLPGKLMRHLQQTKGKHLKSVDQHGHPSPRPTKPSRQIEERSGRNATRSSCQISQNERQDIRSSHHTPAKAKGRPCQVLHAMVRYLSPVLAATPSSAILLPA